MARTRRNHQRASPSHSTTMASNKNHESSTVRTPKESTEESMRAHQLEGKGTKITSQLDLGTDDESTEDEETRQKEDGEWKTVTWSRKKENANQPKTKEIADKVSDSKPQRIQLEIADVDESIEYWSNAIFCYVLGANPPWTVINGFAQRVWKGKGIKQVSFMPNGIFLVRFDTKEAQQEALKNDALIFDNKPVIIEEWTPNASLIKKRIKTIPIWIKLRNLELKFWGEKCFTKVVSGIGKYLDTDNATRNRQFLGFAKIKVEVQLDQKFPSTIEFVDEMGIDQTIGVTYDWLPVTCTNCNSIGHYKEDCRKSRNNKEATRKTWQQKPGKKDPPTETNVSIDDNATTAVIITASTPSPAKQHHQIPISTTGNIIYTGEQRGGRVEGPDQPQGFQTGGISFLDKLTLSIKSDLIKQAEMEAGDSLLNG